MISQAPRRAEGSRAACSPLIQRYRARLRPSNPLTKSPMAINVPGPCLECIPFPVRDNRPGRVPYPSPVLFARAAAGHASLGSRGFFGSPERPTEGDLQREPSCSQVMPCYRVARTWMLVAQATQNVSNISNHPQPSIPVSRTDACPHDRPYKAIFAAILGLRLALVGTSRRDDAGRYTPRLPRMNADGTAHRLATAAEHLLRQKLGVGESILTG